jgi:predicted porin
VGLRWLCLREGESMSYSRFIISALLVVILVTFGKPVMRAQQIATAPVVKHVATETPAHADQAAATKSSEEPLTWHGLTLYGTIDIGLLSETNGRPYNNNFGTGFETIIAPNGNESITHYADNGLAQSVIGVRGDEPLGNGVSLIFKLEPGFNPVSMRFTNVQKALVMNNGIAKPDQTANTDGPRAGRIDNGLAFFGIHTAKFGTATFGRQFSLFADNSIKYDPIAGSYAFSLISYIPFVGGAGDVQDVFLDQSLKYTLQIKHYRVGLLEQFTGSNPVFSPDHVYGSTRQLNLGGDFHRFSADAAYSKRHDGIYSATLSAAQILTLPTNSLAATISDNEAYTVMGKYTVGRYRVSAGYDHTRYANPSSPLAAPITEIGGYELSVLNQSAYNVNKILQVYWTGLKTSVTKKLDISGAYYGWRQNSYSGNGCTNNSSPKCSGDMNVISGVGTYKLPHGFSTYGGMEWSYVINGSSYTYLANHNIVTMFGGQYHF